jgi:hypothetical protein
VKFEVDKTGKKEEEIEESIGLEKRALGWCFEGAQRGGEDTYAPGDERKTRQ